MALLGARLVRKLSKRVLSESKQLEERADRLERAHDSECSVVAPRERNRVDVGPREHWVPFLSPLPAAEDVTDCVLPNPDSAKRLSAGAMHCDIFSARVYFGKSLLKHF